MKFIKKQITDINKFGAKELFRKFLLSINLLILLLMDIIAILPCIIIRLISPWFIVRVSRIPAGNFGDFVWMTGMYYCKKKLKIDLPPRRHIDLVYIHYKDKIHNKQLAKMWKRKLNFLSAYILDPIDRVGRYIPGWENHIISSLINPERDLNGYFEKIQVLDFTTEEKIYGKKTLAKFGLKERDKFVCLVVRDAAYQLKKISARYRDWSYHDYRHIDIDKFTLAAEELTKKGYYVFRMGVVAEKPFRSKNSKIIDYVNSNLRSDFMDVYLGANCSFCISTGTGYEEMPVIFKKPLVQLHAPFGDIVTHSEKFFVLTRHHILKKEKRKLSLSEIFTHGVAYTYSTQGFEEKGIRLVENTPEEIKDIVIEMAESLEFDKKLNSEDKKLQETFKSLFADNIKRVNYHLKRAYFKKKCHIEIFHGKIKARYSTNFLRKNRYWLR